MKVGNRLLLAILLLMIIFGRFVIKLTIVSGRPPWCLNAFSLFNAAQGIKIKKEYDAPQQKGKVLFLIAKEKFK